MTQKHKHAEYIIAFANGEAVQYKDNGSVDGWYNVDCLFTFEDADYVFRMKPKTVVTKGYKRFAYRAADDGKWYVYTYMEGDTYSLLGDQVAIDKEWQYYTFEGEG